MPYPTYCQVESILWYASYMSTLEDIRAVTDQIHGQRALVKERDMLIAQARDEGVAWDAIIEACGLARQSAYNAYQRGIALRATRALREVMGD